jgi:hypothetical protein
VDADAGDLERRVAVIAAHKRGVCHFGWVRDVLTSCCSREVCEPTRDLADAGVTETRRAPRQRFCRKLVASCSGRQSE